MTKNKGSIITIAFFLIHIIFLTIYMIKGINQLKTDILKNIIEKLENNDENTREKIIIIKEDNKWQSRNSRQSLKEKEEKENIKSFKDLRPQKNKKEENKREDNRIARNSKRNTKLIKRNIFKYPPKKVNSFYKELKLDSKNIINNSRNNNILIIDKKFLFKDINKNEKFQEKKNNINQILETKRTDQKEKEKLDGYELNDLDYESAIKLDKRNFIQIYWSLIKREHSIIFTFITKDDHNITYIKYSKIFFLIKY